MTNLVERLFSCIREKRRQVVVIGDVMVDRWIDGRMEQCQDGCPKFVQEKVTDTPGGAANAERCLSGWGVATSLYGYALNDCPIKYRYVEDSRIVFRADDDGEATRSSGYKWAHQLGLEMVGHAGAVLLSDYDKGFLTPEFIREIARICMERCIPCIADVKRESSIYQGCILKANSDWYIRYGHADVVTRGKDSPLLDELIQVRYLPTVRCVNHVGAGDCFAAHLTLALAYGFSLDESAVLAHSAGRVYVQSPYNRPPLPAEIAEDLSSTVST